MASANQICQASLVLKQTKSQLIMDISVNQDFFVQFITIYSFKEQSNYLVKPGNIIISKDKDLNKIVKIVQKDIFAFLELLDFLNFLVLEEDCVF